MENTNTTVTAKELTVLNLIKEYQNEEGHSEFLSEDAKTKSVAGLVSSLEKKQLIYDSYSNFDNDEFDGKRFKMWCLTHEGAEIVGKPESWS